MKDNGKPTVVVTEEVYNKSKFIFDLVADMEIVTAPAEEGSLSEIIREKNAFAVVLGTEKYTGALYEKMREGGILARFGVGCDGLDFIQVKSNKLFVTNTPEVLDLTVAEFTVFLAAELLRKIGNANKQMSLGIWTPSIGNDLSGKTWGIIGFGNIGKRLSKILSFGFGVRVIGFENSKLNIDEMKNQYGVEQIYTNYSDFASQADIISLHLPANSQTYHFLDKARFEELKQGAIIINTGRGSLIDEQALYNTLINGKIAAAALDVFESEPYVPKATNMDLRKLSNVVMTPHLASSTTQCCERMALSVLSDLRLALRSNYDQMNLVNF